MPRNWSCLPTRGAWYSYTIFGIDHKLRDRTKNASSQTQNKKYHWNHSATKRVFGEIWRRGSSSGHAPCHDNRMDGPARGLRYVGGVEEQVQEIEMVEKLTPNDASWTMITVIFPLFLLHSSPLLHSRNCKNGRDCKRIFKKSRSRR